MCCVLAPGLNILAGGRFLVLLLSLMEFHVCLFESKDCNIMILAMVKVEVDKANCGNDSAVSFFKNS